MGSLSVKMDIGASPPNASFLADSCMHLNRFLEILNYISVHLRAKVNL